jgi:hypothetical protein
MPLLHFSIVVYFSAQGSGQHIDSTRWKIVYKNTRVENDMKEFKVHSSEHHLMVINHLEGNPLLTDGSIVIKMSGRNKKLEPYEYRLPHGYRLIYLVHKSIHEVEVLRVGEHFK